MRSRIENVPPHPSHRRIIQERVICNQSRDANPSSLDCHLSEPHKLYVVVIQILLQLQCPPLTNTEAVHELVWLNQSPMMGLKICREQCVWRIADDDREVLVALDLVNSLSLVGERRHPLLKVALPLIATRWLESIGQVNTSPFVATETVASLVKLEANLHVGNGVRGH